MRDTMAGAWLQDMARSILSSFADDARAAASFKWAPSLSGLSAMILGDEIDPGMPRSSDLIFRLSFSSSAGVSSLPALVC